MDFKPLYRQSLTALGSKLHFAAHSHHLWPDCVAQAQNQYVQDAFTYADEKWGAAIAPLEQSVKQYIATHLQLNDPNQICFGPNIHTLFFRLVSCFDLRAPLKILSTDSEFYSFSRQAQRLSEYDNIHVTKINVLPMVDFKNRLLEEVQTGSYQMIYLSQVFFNSGLAVDFLDELANITSAETMIVIDGYHAFGAIPTNLTRIQDRVFYLAGGYKYLQSGEGICFMTVPRSANTYRPLYTGWFAEFDSLDDHQSTVSYAPNASRFLGATTDPSGLYRMHAVWTSWNQQGIHIPNIHQHVMELQKHFLMLLSQKKLHGLSIDDLLHVQQNWEFYGHFLTFQTSKAKQIQALLREKDIITDCREDRLRFGFGMYHSIADISSLFERL
ncbi:hypothetical protein BFP72_00050 [Reichenbachiella sp. 5M10]|uniref:aminotransferase class V-fold PLP-dependent enzyme n=1 Tax=Reichenbachiella sp. 5M10 TaxID=1889772 RepID=UPI000C149A37|nr:aminotransferase class V-fold PLP-dependent enzyme [Reichenbachiella sp. 5M10]PIB33935.1 hypothetical protein BFP72_00050 [Reichenbachiella sp. 5M10]